MSKFPHRIHAIKSDNGSIFTNYYLGTNKRSDATVKTMHALDVFCTQNNIIHYPHPIGSHITARAPRSLPFDSILNSPRCALTMALTTESPMPMPMGLSSRA